MSQCLSCGTPLPDAARFCAACGLPVEPPPNPDSRLSDAETIAAAPATGPTRAVARSSSSAPRSGWLSSSGHLEHHGRFQPGELLGERYRITGRLGRGGMGEVYRADDMTLGQIVALKFLPEAFERDTVRLAQLHGEVRLARQIAHKNVCRVYDIGEADGLPFLTMEYVDGEDLSTLLRRIGRLPEDKAVDLARQLCAGLAAAHERGVLHRDLKPANVMIDGLGQVRITDFGLAALAGEVEQVRAGTPAYMAPEQLAGKEATPQSDIYALGLVLYEIFTGRRRFTAETIAELLRQHDDGDFLPPTAIVGDLDPAIERAILRCLDRDPQRRPRTALAVAAGLPGGDPLAAALAAGETPSPEMVAAAGERQALSTGAAVSAVGAVSALIVAAAMLSANGLTTRLPLDKPPSVLVDRAQQVLARLGYDDRPASTRWAFQSDGDYLRYVREERRTASVADPYAERPGGLIFQYRTSPRALTPQNPLGAVTMADPPLVVSGMTLVGLDTEGRLLSFVAIPPQRDNSPETSDRPAWETLFSLAGLDIDRFTPVTPTWLPRAHADARAAWEGTFGDTPDVSLRIEAAAWRARPTYFQMIGPWTRPAQMQEAPVSRGRRLFNMLSVLTTVVLLLGALVMARTNVRDGRGDRAAATRIAFVAVAGQLITWLLNDPHPTDPGTELNRFFLSIGEALFAGGVLYMMYLALEPAMRRYWPDSVLASTRLVQKRLLDPRVGRDVLVGLGCGAVLVLLTAAQWPLQSLLGLERPPVQVGNLRYLEGPTYVIGFFASLLSFQAAFNAMWCVIAIVVLKRLLKRVWLAALSAILFLTLVAASGFYVDQPGVFWINFGVALSVIGLLVAVVVRFGLLATVVVFLTIYVMTSTPFTVDVSRWDFPATALSVVLLVGLALLAGWAVRTEPRG